MTEVELDFYKRPLKDSRIIDIENRLRELENLLKEDMQGLTGRRGGDGKTEDLLGRLKRNEEKTRKTEYDLSQLKERMDEIEAGLLEKLKEMEKEGRGMGDVELKERIQDLENEAARQSHQIDKNSESNEKQDYRLQKLEEELKRLRQEMKRNQEGAQKEKKSREEQIHNLEEQIKDLKRRVEALEADRRRIDQLEQKLIGMAKKLAELSQYLQKPQVMHMDSTSPDLAQKIDRLKEDLGQLRRELLRMLKELEGKLQNKVGQPQLDALEDRILERLDSILNTLSKKYADKAETKRAIRALDKQLRHLMDNLQHSSPQGDDAMFARKPLGGWSCASCQKGLINLCGLMAEYYPWSRFPLRDPQDRIAKVGQGFSKMLQKLDPLQLTKENINSPQNLDRSRSTPFLPHLPSEDTTSPGPQVPKPHQK